MDFWSMFQSIAKDYGLFAALFLALFFWTIYQNDKREKRYIQREDKYISIVEKFTDSFKNIESDIEQIKTKLWS